MPLTEKQQEAWKKEAGEKEFKIGRQNQKSGWLEFLPEDAGLFGGKKRWIRLNAGLIMTFVDEQEGYNNPETEHTKRPEEKETETEGFSLPSMPSLPSIGKISMPSFKKPSFKGLKNTFSLPKEGRARNKGEYYQRIEVFNGATVKRDGTKIIIENANYIEHYADGLEHFNDGKAKFVFVAEDKEEAASWYASIGLAGAKEI